MRVEKVMTPKVWSCCPDDSLNHAAWAMWERDCGCIPVVDDQGSVVGMITDRDIAMAALIQGEPLRDLRVSSAMSRDVATIGQKQSVSDAESIMSERQVRRLPVVDADGRLAGVLSLRDIVRASLGNAVRGRPTADDVVNTLAAITTDRVPAGDEFVSSTRSGSKPSKTPIATSKVFPKAQRTM